jgi:hypothetical protein
VKEVLTGTAWKKEPGLRDEKMRRIQCQEETEQAQGAKALEQVEEWAKVGAVGAVALPQALVETAFAPAVVKECPTSKEVLALTRNAPSVGRQ